MVMAHVCVLSFHNLQVELMISESESRILIMTTTVLGPRESAELIAAHSKDVTICEEAMDALAKNILQGVKDEPDSMKRWNKQALNVQSTDPTAVDWIFFADTLNFSFWSDDDNNKFGVIYEGKIWTGYWSLCAAMNRAIKKGIPLTDAKFYSKLKVDELKDVFKSDTECEMPLLDKRLAVLRETGNILLEKFDGSFVNVVKAAGGSAQSLVSLVVTNFPSYRDQATFRGQRVSLYKRAQILVGDIWACFEGQGLGQFRDIDWITMFADYRIPQALAYFGVLKYSEELTKLLNENHMFESGDLMEVELRGCSIHAVEGLVDRVRKLLSADPGTKDVVMNSVVLDHYLWDYRREHEQDTRSTPFHKIRCIYY